MKNCKATTTSLVQNPGMVKDDGAIKIEILVYKGLIGSLLYLIATTLDLMYVESFLSRFMSSPFENHFLLQKNS